jgi:hypothetical protein
VGETAGRAVWGDAGEREEMAMVPMQQRKGRNGSVLLLF